MPSTPFIANDLVSLKDNPEIRAIVQTNSREIDAGFLLLPQKSEWFAHIDIPKELRLRWELERRCPRGWSVISFIYPYSGYTLVSDDLLVLLDRSHQLGDIVKRNLSDTVSGTIIGGSGWCSLRPIFGGHPLSNDLAAHRKEKDFELRHIPETELSNVLEYQPSDIVIYKDWVGVIDAITHEISIRLENGSVIVINDLEGIQVPTSICEVTFDSALSETLAQRRVLTFDKLADAKGDLSLGHLVFANKAALLRATWISGKMKANWISENCSALRGIVVAVNTLELYVDWIQPNPFLPELRSSYLRHPSNNLDKSDLKDVRVYNDFVPTRESKSIQLPGKLLGGDRVRFADAAGAGAKYSSHDGVRGIYQTITQIESQGYDANLFTVTSTESRVLVQWQDMSITEENSTHLTAPIALDDRDVWPGTIVAFLSKKVDTSMETNQLQPERVGVVQRVDAAERLARIRWFAHPEVTIVNIPEPCLLSGSRFGILTSNETEESLYEITEIEALNSYLRDVVLVDIRKQQPLTLQQTEAFSMSKPSHDGLINQNYHWIGHVISQGTDGFLTVRLGLLDTALDIRVSVEAVVGFIKPKEFKEEDGEDGEDGEDDLEEYEDIDEEDEDAFFYSTTDDIVVCEGVASQDTETMGSFLTTETEKILSSDDTTAEKLSNSMSTGDAHRSITHRPSLVKHYDLDFTKYPSKPLQFELLDEPVPHDHHFSSSTPILKAALLRRIRKEHSILESSLPEGIWVIAWTENLTLLRVLIVGPQGTPYSLAPFVIDFHFKSDFPNTPPEAYFHSWTNGNRINPNLYEDGKVCLSLLGTWPSMGKNESWSESSSVLQILVSLMGLVLVEEPFFNEPGFEKLVGTSDANRSSALYTERAFLMARGFIVHVLSHSVAGLDPVLRWLYCARSDSPQLLHIILEQCDTLLADRDIAAEGDGEAPRFSAGAKLLLRKHVGAMKGFLAQEDEPNESYSRIL